MWKFYLLIFLLAPSPLLLLDSLSGGIIIYSEKAVAPTPVLSPGKSHGGSSLVVCSPRGCWESDTTERLHFHFLFSCIGKGNGNRLQCSYLENPRDGGAWWAAVYGVAQSRTWLKRLSSSIIYLYIYWDSLLELHGWRCYTTYRSWHSGQCRFSAPVVSSRPAGRLSDFLWSIGRGLSPLPSP